jgi:type II secretory pathway component PulK
MALMMALCVLFVASLLTVQVLDTVCWELSALRTQIVAEQAACLADSGIQTVVARLEADPTFAGPETEIMEPGKSYSVTVTVDNSYGAGFRRIRSTGTVDGVSRSVEALVQY